MIRGEKIVLRPYREGFTDEEIRLHYKWSRDPEITRWSNSSPTGLDFEEFARQMAQQAGPQPDRELFAIVTHSGRMIGRIGYFNLSRDRREAEMGIVIGEKDCWGQGFGRDAVVAFLHHVFCHRAIQTIYLFTLKQNERARRAFTAGGFSDVGASKHFSFEFGEYEDIRMEVNRDDWLSAHSECERNSAG